MSESGSGLGGVNRQKLGPKATNTLSGATGKIAFSLRLSWYAVLTLAIFVAHEASSVTPAGSSTSCVAPHLRRPAINKQDTSASDAFTPPPVDETVSTRFLSDADRQEIYRIKCMDEESDDASDEEERCMQIFRRSCADNLMDMECREPTVCQGLKACPGFNRSIKVCVRSIASSDQ